MEHHDYPDRIWDRIPAIFSKIRAGLDLSHITATVAGGGYFKVMMVLARIIGIFYRAILQ